MVQGLTVGTSSGTDTKWLLQEALALGHLQGPHPRSLVPIELEPTPPPSALGLGRVVSGPG